MSIQLPDDAISTGYKETRPFHHEQVFSSKSCSFEGTEREFVNAGHAYQYIQLDDYSRRVLI